MEERPTRGHDRALCSWLLLGIALLTLFPGNVGAQTEAPTEPFELEHHLKVGPLDSGAFVVTDVDYFRSNTLVVKMADGTVVIVSSPYENLGTATLMEWIDRALSPVRVVAINTHFHLDGTGGNDVFHQEGVEIWASKLTRDLQITEGPNVLAESLQYFGTPELKDRVLRSHVVPAEHAFPLEDGKVFDFSGESVRVFFPGPAHSPDNVVVYFPGRKLLFGGCMIKPETLGYLRDANIAEWATSARRLRRFDADVVVPGHGKWGGAELIERTIEVAEAAAKSPDE
ncbi:MAG: metallo-beta-lactamase [Candidatus Eisenbacteria bacterium]|uniref:beta-lactamase n=1 Tax=Eiseniibacteriota bacterium TaxID=2212470 RepID=A0A956LYZ1_UNCEI|nr:metallo-beta-lactamase [Candidatus Eisenbacteria bacterium]